MGSLLLGGHFLQRNRAECIASIPPDDPADKAKQRNNGHDKPYRPVVTETYRNDKHAGADECQTDEEDVVFLECHGERVFLDLLVSILIILPAAPFPVQVQLYGKANKHNTYQNDGNRTVMMADVADQPKHEEQHSD